MKNSKFCALPQELQIQILSNLDAVSLTRCAMTCQSIYETLKTSSLLLYTIQLQLDGLKDAETSLSHSDLIEYLVKRRQAWQFLGMKEPVDYQIPSNCCGGEFVGGAFAYTSLENDCLRIIWVPTASNTKRHGLQTSSIGISAVRYLTMDLTQDLIVLLEDDGTPPSINIRVIRVHIRTISTNTIHLQTQQSPLEVTVIPKPRYTNIIKRVVLQIANNILALYFRTAWKEARVLIWDWTTSELMLDTSVSFDPSLPTLGYHFGLLDSTYFFVTCLSNFGSIRLYRLAPSHAVTERAVHLATLHLPPTSPGTTILKMPCYAGPIEAKTPPGIPFVISDEDRLHMFMLEYQYKAPGRDIWRFNYFNLFLHQRLLIKYARQAHTENFPLDIPWAEWGPANTRFTPSSLSPYASRWMRYIHGQRAIFPRGTMGNVGRTAPSSSAEVYDFSLAAVLSAKETLSASSKSTSGIFLPSSMIRTEDFPLFLDDVETHLPCVMSRLDFTRTYATYMICADGIVGIKARPIPFTRDYLCK